MEQKRAERAAARAARRAIPPEERERRAEAMLEHALALPELAKARAVGCYVSVRSEADTRLLLRALLAKGILVAVPVTEGDRLRYARLDHPWALVEGAHQIPEPREPLTEIRGDELDIIIVPGLRFGRDGTRLGNGGGHFDRYLAAHPKALRVALAFSEQVVDTIPSETHDQGMDVIITENGRIRVGRQPT